jgi:large subunit ribosomal protein L17
LGRNSSHRKAMLRNMVTSLFTHEQIETTHAKAKVVRPVAEKMISLAKRGDLHARRQALAVIKDKTVAHRLFEEVKDRYLDRQGGCVRILKKGIRKGDGAPISIVQLLPMDEAKKSGKKKAKKPGASAKTGTKGKKGTEKRKMKGDDTASDASASEKAKSG